MKLKLTLHRSEQEPVDLLATVDAATTVGDLAAYLERADPNGSRTPPAVDGSAPTLGLVADNHRALDPRLPVGDSGLDSGATVSVTRSGTRYTEGDNGSAAVATVVSGPDAGHDFNLHAGSNLIGRERGCEIRLTDPLVSRQHARLNIGDVAEIIDLGSANGIALADAATARTIMRAGDRVRLGDTELTVRVLRPATRRGSEDISTSGLDRSPRLEKPYEGREITPPDPPQRPPTQRFQSTPQLPPRGRDRRRRPPIGRRCSVRASKVSRSSPRGQRGCRSASCPKVGTKTFRCSRRIRKVSPAGSRLNKS